MATKPTKPTNTLDFSKVFAANSSIQPFTWLDSEYLKGWEAIQQTPPARQQFDALQSHSDQKENWLYNQYLEGYVDKYLGYLDEVKAPINSPTFKGDPKAPTPSWGDNDTSLATTAFVQHWVHELQEAIEGAGGGEGGNGQGITQYGEYFTVWGNILCTQWTACTTDSNGEGTAYWPFSFGETIVGQGYRNFFGNNGDYVGDYVVFGVLEFCTLDESPIFSIPRNPLFYKGDSFKFRVVDKNGNPLAGRSAGFFGWGFPPDTIVRD